MLSRRQYVVAMNPWITPDILTAIKHKNKLYPKYVKSKCPVILKEYKMCRNAVTHTKTKAKQKYFEHLFKNARNTSDT